MHIAGKIFLGLGAVMFVLGGIMTIGGGDTLSEIEWDVEGESVFEGPDGTYTHTNFDLMIIYVDDSVDCETFELTYTNETGAQGYDADEMDDSDGDGDPANDNDRPFFEKEECADDGMSVRSVVATTRRDTTASGPSPASMISHTKSRPQPPSTLCRSSVPWAE